VERVVCESTEQIRIAQALRYEVYCLEKGWVDPNGPNGIEEDAYDSEAVHFLVYDDEGEAVGTSRLILGSRQSLPATRYLGHCADDLDLVPEQTAEVSRMASRRGSRSQDLAVFMNMIRAMWDWSMPRSVKTWLAVSDAPLFHLIKRIGTPIIAVGPEVEYVGSVCIPAAMDVPGIRAVLERRGY
jgi:N-acyl-L-homoserine lactone synthetase